MVKRDSVLDMVRDAMLTAAAFTVVWSLSMWFLAGVIVFNGGSFPWVPFWVSTGLTGGDHPNSAWIVWVYLPLASVLFIYQVFDRRLTYYHAEHKLNLMKLLWSRTTAKGSEYGDLKQSDYNLEEIGRGLGVKARRIKFITRRSAEIYKLTSDNQHGDFVIAEAKVKDAIRDFWDSVEAVEGLIEKEFKPKRPKVWADALNW